MNREEAQEAVLDLFPDATYFHASLSWSWDRADPDLCRPEFSINLSKYDHAKTRAAYSYSAHGKSWGECLLRLRAEVEGRKSALEDIRKAER
jgi:hypothetical protein